MRRRVLVLPLTAAVTLVFASCALRRVIDPEGVGQKSTAGQNSNAPQVSDARHFTETELHAADDVVGYAQLCKQEIGIPDAVQQPFNCLDGTEIPVQINGQPLNAQNYQDLATHKIGCDLGSWLGDEPCANYTFVQKRQLAPDVVALLLCRDRGFTSWKNRDARLADLRAAPNAANFDAAYTFDSLGLIWTNAKTGKTCFFDFVGKTYGGYVPSPDDDHAPDFAALPDPKPPKELGPGSGKEAVWQRDARTTWKSPSAVVQTDACITCHDGGAFKNSPWIAQVFQVPHNDPSVPLLIVGSFFDTWSKKFPVRAISTAPIRGADGREQAQACTSCHRIGSLATCSTELYYAAGLAAPATMSKLGNSFAVRTWMPPEPASWHGKSDQELQTLWNTAYKTHVGRLKCCCDNPNAIGCFSQDITQSPLPAPVAGTGPAICP